ncbi:hypothetical protein ATHL_02397 [Anaerolinea thermolimosa]|nr:hypothetical protein ATHL_02397 [Anaerolinea thermolimosa]
MGSIAYLSMFVNKNIDNIYKKKEVVAHLKFNGLIVTSVLTATKYPEQI